MSTNCALVRGALAATIACGALATCGPGTDQTTARPQTEAERRATLQSLGYIASSPQRADPRRNGATALEPERVSPGYNLFTVHGYPAVFLSNLDGRTVQRWDIPCEEKSRARLLSNGDLLVLCSADVVSDAPRAGKSLLRLSWSGETRWQVQLGTHHDIVEADNGELYALTHHSRSDPRLFGGRLFDDNRVTRLTRDGVEIESRSLAEAIVSTPDLLTLRPVPEKWVREDGAVDVIHANSVELMQDPKLAERDPVYALGNVLVSLRHQDAVVVVNPLAGRVVWAWGPDQLSGPHDARVLENGHVLVFDNGRDRGWSRAVEVDPLSGEIAWQYGDDEKHRFYSNARGSSQRLPNGNTLITCSEAGEAFEVAPDGTRVWQYWNPVLDDEGHRRVIPTMTRYPRELVDPLLAGGRDERPTVGRAGAS